MSDKGDFDINESKLPEEIQQEIKHGQRLLTLTRDRRRKLEEKIAAFGPSNVPSALAVELDQTIQEISKLENQLESLENKAKEFKTLIPSTQTAEGSFIAQASYGNSATIVLQTRPNEPEVTEEAKLFVPAWSVLRSKVQYVDANLALKFADESQNLNIMLSFMTLFLGSAISFAVSLVAADTSTDIVLLSTATAFTVLLTIIFGILAWRAWKIAAEAKKQLFNDNTSRQN